VNERIILTPELLEEIRICASTGAGVGMDVVLALVDEVIKLRDAMGRIRMEEE
jgi:hypothetical protein